MCTRGEFAHSLSQSDAPIGPLSSRLLILRPYPNTPSRVEKNNTSLVGFKPQQTVCDRLRLGPARFRLHSAIEWIAKTGSVDEKIALIANVEIDNRPNGLRSADHP